MNRSKYLLGALSNLRQCKNQSLTEQLKGSSSPLAFQNSGAQLCSVAKPTYRADAAVQWTSFIRVASKEK